MKVLIVGANGQLGWELERTLPKGMETVGLDFPEIDITRPELVEAVVDRHQPDWIVNAAAYTDVDGAQSHETQAQAVNCDGARNVARAAKDAGVGLVHVSTDFIFNGEKGSPYKWDDTPDPKSVYGKTKLAGERAVQEVFGANTLIIRTAWLYSSHGNNFVHTMIKLMKQRSALSIIEDQIGTPCWANGLALAVWACIQKQLSGIYHWTDAGAASWYDFSVAIQEEALALGILENPISIWPIPTTDYPTPAQRPAYSVLDKTGLRRAAGLEPVHWRTQLRKMMAELRA